LHEADKVFLIILQNASVHQFILYVGLFGRFQITQKRLMSSLIIPPLLLFLLVATDASIAANEWGKCQQNNNEGNQRHENRKVSRMQPANQQNLFNSINSERNKQTRVESSKIKPKEFYWARVD
jgi:hypothetical protein